MRIGQHLGMGDDGSATTTDTGIDTSLIAVGSSSSVDSSLLAAAQSNCATMGGLFDPTTGGCTGSGGSSSCPSGYALESGVCAPICVVGALDANGNTIASCGGTSSGAASSTASCPSGSTCSIVPGVPNTNIYLAAASVGIMFFYLAIKR